MNESCIEQYNKRLDNSGKRRLFGSIYPPSEEQLLDLERFIKEGKDTNEIDCYDDVLKEYYVKALDKIRSINNKLLSIKDKRVLIYCAGLHTEMLFRFTIAESMDIMGIIDRTVERFGKYPIYKIDEIGSLEFDYIIISSLVRQREIARTLKEKGFGEKIIVLYNDDDNAEFYMMENKYGPDLAYENKYGRLLSVSEVRVMAENKMQELTNESNSYLTYSIKNIDDAESKDKDEELYGFKCYEKDNERVAIIVQGPIVEKKTVYSKNG